MAKSLSTIKAKLISKSETEQNKSLTFGIDVQKDEKNRVASARTAIVISQPGAEDISSFKVGKEYTITVSE